MGSSSAAPVVEAPVGDLNSQPPAPPPESSTAELPSRLYSFPQIPEAVFEEVLFSILEDDLTSAFSTPGQLYLLLVGIQNFPKVLRPEKLKVLLGTSAVVTTENIPR